MNQICTICNNQLEAFDTNINICGNDNCLFISRTMYIESNEYLKQYINNNLNETKLLLTIAHAAINNDKHPFAPLPKFKNVAISLDDIKTIINNSNISEDIKSISNMESERIIYDYLGEVKYGLYKFILKSNIIQIKNVELFKIKNLKTFEVSYEDKYTEYFDKEILNNNYCYLYHGSPLQNWYSIMTKGLKVFSNTTHMKNGMAYGPGIYTSNNISVSNTYSSNYSKTSIIAVFQVIGKQIDYKKTESIFVVPTEKLVRLRYLILNQKTFTPEEIQAINQKFMTRILTEKSKEIKYFSSMRNKRLMKEIQQSQKPEVQELGMVFTINEENMYQWKVKLFNFDKDSELYKDLTNANMDFIEMEILFEQQYPIKPPFIRIIKPVFKYRTGHITLGGSICMELLTNQGWSPAYSIETLMIQIKSTIIENGRLDMNKLTYSYSIEEARDSFKRMLITHNWNN